MRWRAIATAAAVSVALAYSTVSGDLLAPFVRVEPVRAVPYLGSALVSLGDALVLLLLAALAAGRSPRRVIGQTGLRAPIGRPALWALLWMVPAVGVCLALARVAPDAHVQDIAWLGIGGPDRKSVV